MSERVQLRLAIRTDATPIAVMSRDLIETGLGWSWTPARIVHHVRCPDSVVLAAVCGSRLIGFAIMSFADDEAHLKLLAVAPGHRRLGIGRRLVEWLEQSALVAGTPIVYLELRATNQGTLAFYRKLGYRKFGLVRGYYRGRECAIRMGRDLWSASHSGID